MERKRDFSSLKDWRVGAIVGIVAGFVAALLIFRWPGHLPPVWGDIPTWIGAIATIGLLIGAIYTAKYAIKTFRAQSQQLDEQRNINAEQTKVLKLQKDELRASLDERRRAQVSRIVISAEPKPLEDEPISSIEVTVHNTSQQAIYDLKLLWPEEYGQWIDPGGPIDLPVLLPDAHHTWAITVKPSIPIREFLGDPSLIRAAVIVRDAAGVRWRLPSDGHFEQLPARSPDENPDQGESNSRP